MRKQDSEVSLAVSEAGDVAVAGDRQSQILNVSVFGLGYVGAVTAGCLSERGFRVMGVDVNSTKVDLINAGSSPIIEDGISDVIQRAVHDGRLRAVQDVAEAVANTELSLVCVGTPSKANGDLDLQYLQRVCQQIGEALAEKTDYHTVVIRSTVLPGTTESSLIPILEQYSGKQAGREFGVCFNPEFLREGSSLKDFHSPPFTLVGVTEQRDAQAVHALYGWLDAEFIVQDIRTAEMVKYINNSYHALKVAFANEVGRLCHALDIDSHDVMDIFCKDTKQNLSGYYLKPGYAFGGSCLPKDLRAILYKGKSLDVPLEVLQATLQSNRTQIERGVEMVQEAGHTKVGLLGLSFKAGTDDLRESPLVSLVETLHGRGYQVKIFDPNVSLSRLVGSNKAYIEQELPHVSKMLLESIDEVIDGSDTIVVGNPNPQFREAIQQVPDSKIIIDLVRIMPQVDEAPANYRGIGW